MLSQGLGSLLGHVVGEGSGPQEGLGLAEGGEQNTPSIGCVLASMGLGSPRPCSLALEQRAPHASGVCPSKSHPVPSGTPTPLGIQSAVRFALPRGSCSLWAAHGLIQERGLLGAAVRRSYPVCALV